MGLFSSIGDIFSGGGGGDLISGVISGADILTGGWASDQMSKSSAKRQYNYNSNLQQQNINFQKYLAENAHQLEMADLQKAGLNPALTATGSSAGAIAGGSASQGTSGGQMAELGGIVNAINQTRMTNADVDLKKAEEKSLESQTNKNEGGFFGEILGAGIGEGITSEIKKAAQKWKATSAKRQKELKKRNNNESYWNKLTTFEAKSTR